MTPPHIHEVELALDKLLGFKRIAAFSNDHADLARAMDATFNKVGEAPPPREQCRSEASPAWTTSRVTSA
jgi:hypothetical protein